MQSKNAPHSQGEYDVYSTFQSHEPEFDYLKSLEIEEKINKIKWLPQQNAAHSLLSTNGEAARRAWVPEPGGARACVSVRPSTWVPERVCPSMCVSEHVRVCPCARVCGCASVPEHTCMQLWACDAAICQQMLFSPHSHGEHLPGLRALTKCI